MPANLADKLRHLKEKAVLSTISSVGFVYHKVTGKNLVINRFRVRKPDFISRDIAKNLYISSNWTDFSLHPPLEIKKNKQHLRIFIEGYDKYSELIEHGNNGQQIDFSKIILADGTIISLRVQIIDEFGTNYDLEFIWTPYAVVFTKELPSDRKYVQIKISSDKPFNAYKVNWLDINEETS